MHGSVLERLQRRIDLERLSKLLYARQISVEATFIVEVTANGVVPQAAMQGKKRALSAAADTFMLVMRGHEGMHEGQVATYLSDIRLLFVDRAAPSASAPSW